MNVRCRFIIMALSFCASCYSGGTPFDGLAPRNADDHGPSITWDLDARPLPEVPFPNDVGTRTDLASPTGLRVNVTREAPTAHERKLRRLISGLDGFGIFAPMWVKFEDRINVADLHALQTNDDPTDDGIYLFNVDPDSPHFGARVDLDVGPGPYDYGKTRFPLGLENPGRYFDNDPHVASSNLLFETETEADPDHDGEVDPEDDLDGDGVLDRPNLWGEVLQDDYARLDDFVERLAPLYDPDGTASPAAVRRVHQYLDLMTFYELETNTLIFRPVLPLEEGTTYAVVLTRNIRGAQGGSPIRSPFLWVNHLQQTDALLPLLSDGILASVAVAADDIAFAWSFTTQTATADVAALRAGLYGVGPFARLAKEFPARVEQVFRTEMTAAEWAAADADPDIGPATIERPGNVFTLTASRLIGALRDPLVSKNLGFDPDSLEPLFQSYENNIDYFVFFSVDSPAFIENDDGVFRVDAQGGGAEYGRAPLYVVCAIPKETGGRGPPYPVAFYSHGYTSSRFEMLGFAGSIGKFGIATCSIDAYGHGLPRMELITAIAEDVLAKMRLARVADLLFVGRGRDLNADGATDSGGDFWTSNTFHTRDVVRQTMIDYMQTIRVLRSFTGDGGTMPVDVDGDGRNELAGDFDGDGLPDLGGEKPYFIFGQSLGGIMSGVLGAAEPAIVAAVPGSGGGGLVNLALRSAQGGVVQAVYLPIMGPLIVGRPSGNVAGRTDIAFDVLDVNSEAHLTVASFPDPSTGHMDDLEGGDRVRVTNLDNGEFDEASIRAPATGRAKGLFRLHIPADYGDRITLEFYRRNASTPYRVIDTFDRTIRQFQGEDYQTGDPLRVLQEGFGFRRQTPSVRRLFGIAQMVIDPADPVNYARHFADPLDLPPEGRVPTNMLNVVTVGDMNVPVDTGITLSRAAGHWSLDGIDPRFGKTTDQYLLDNFAIEGLESVRRLAVHPCYYDPSAVLFDVDEASRGADPDQGPHATLPNPHPDCALASPPVFCDESCPSVPIASNGEPVNLGLRATVHYPWGTSGMRIPYLKRTGIHGFNVPDPNLTFDYNLYQINQIGWYFATEGRELVDDPCMASYSEPCSFY